MQYTRKSSRFLKIRAWLCICYNRLTIYIDIFKFTHQNLCETYMYCFLVSGSRKYYTGACLRPLKIGCSPPQAQLHQAALCRSKERCSSMDRFANLQRWRYDGLSLLCQFRPWKNPFIPGWRFQEFPTPMDIFLSFRMAKPHVKELWMFVFGLGESPAEVGNGMPEHKHKRS